MGRPAGTLEYRQRTTFAITTKTSRPLPAVIRLPRWSALPLIRQCISARVGYLARVSELEAYLPAFRLQDRRGHSLRRRRHAQENRFQLLASLPFSCPR